MGGVYMSTQQKKIDAWYENFIQQISIPPFSFLPHLPEDKGRLLKMLDEPKMDQTEMESPVGPDEDLFEKRNELYELASQGKLYIFELGNSYDCSQVRIEPADKLLYDLKNEVIKEPVRPMPQEQKLGFFKSILNALFGAYEEERLKLKEQFLKATREYNYLANGFQCESSNARSMSGKRTNAIRQNQEVARSFIPSILNDLSNKLENGEDLLSWQKDMYKAKYAMFNAFYAGQPLTKEQRIDILAKSIVGRMGEYKTEQEDKGVQHANKLQELLHDHPEKAEEIETIIKNSPFVQNQAENGDAELVKSTFNPVALDVTVKSALSSLVAGDEQSQKQAEYLKQLMKTTAEPQKEQQAAAHGIGM